MTGTNVNYAVLVALYDNSESPECRRYCYGPECFSSITNTNSLFVGTFYNNIVNEPSLTNAVLDSEVVPTNIILPEFSFDVALKGEASNLNDWLHSRFLISGSPYDIKVQVFLAKYATSFNPTTDLIFSGYISSDSISLKAGIVSLNAKTGMSFLGTNSSGSRGLSSRSFPRQKFSENALIKDTVLQPDPDILDTVVPILFGDWTDDRSFYNIPCRAIDKTLAKDIKFFVSDPGPEGVYGICTTGSQKVKWVDSSGSGRVNAQAKWSEDEDGDPTGLNDHKLYFDYLEAPLKDWSYLVGSFPYNVRVNKDGEEGVSHGDPVFQSGDLFIPSSAGGLKNTGGFIEKNPINIIKLIMEYYCGLEDGFDFDGDDFDDWATLKNNIEVRAYINEDTDVKEVIGQLLFASGLVMTYENGFATLTDNYNVYGLGQDQEVLAQVDPNSSEIVDFTPLIQTRCNFEQTFNYLPDYSNVYGIKLSYKYNPATEAFEKNLLIEKPGTDDNIRKTKDLLELESYWLWREDDAMAAIGSLAQQILFTVQRTLEVEIPFGLDLNTSTILKWKTEDDEENNYFWITSIEQSFSDAKATITAQFQDTHFLYGTWTGESAPTFEEATYEQKIYSGFCCADFEDEAAYYSRWGKDEPHLDPVDGVYEDYDGKVARIEYKPAGNAPQGYYTQASEHNALINTIDHFINVKQFMGPAIMNEDLECWPGEHNGYYAGQDPVKVGREGGLTVPFFLNLEKDHEYVLVKPDDLGGILPWSNAEDRLISLTCRVEGTNDSNSTSFPNSLNAARPEGTWSSSSEYIKFLGSNITISINISGYDLEISTAGSPPSPTIAYRSGDKDYLLIAGFFTIGPKMVSAITYPPSTDYVDSDGNSATYSDDAVDHDPTKADSFHNKFSDALRTFQTTDLASLPDNQDLNTFENFGHEGFETRFNGSSGFVVEGWMNFVDDGRQEILLDKSYYENAFKVGGFANRFYILEIAYRNTNDLSHEYFPGGDDIQNFADNSTSAIFAFYVTDGDTVEADKVWQYDSGGNHLFSFDIACNSAINEDQLTIRYEKWNGLDDNYNCLTMFYRLTATSEVL